MDIKKTSWTLFYGRCDQGKILKRFYLILFSYVYIFMTACTSGQKVTLEDQSQSINEIKKTIISMIGKPRAISQNQRELYSNYFPRKGTSDFNPTKSKERLTAVFIILGDRRPYNIDIQIVIEEKIEGEYEVVGYDNKIANDLKNELDTRLHQSLENRNIIDDFRAF